MACAIQITCGHHTMNHHCTTCPSIRCLSTLNGNTVYCTRADSCALLQHALSYQRNIEQSVSQQVCTSVYRPIRITEQAGSCYLICEIRVDSDLGRSTPVLI